MPDHSLSQPQTKNLSNKEINIQSAPNHREHNWINSHEQINKNITAHTHPHWSKANTENIQITQIITKDTYTVCNRLTRYNSDRDIGKPQLRPLTIARIAIAELQSSNHDSSRAQSNPRVAKKPIRADNPDSKERPAVSIQLPRTAALKRPHNIRAQFSARRGIQSLTISVHSNQRIWKLKDTGDLTTRILKETDAKWRITMN